MKDLKTLLKGSLLADVEDTMEAGNNYAKSINDSRLWDLAYAKSFEEFKHIYDKLFIKVSNTAKPVKTNAYLDQFKKETEYGYITSKVSTIIEFYTKRGLNTDIGIKIGTKSTSLYIMWNTKNNYLSIAKNRGGGFDKNTSVEIDRVFELPEEMEHDYKILKSRAR
jgi:hypothetical protein